MRHRLLGVKERISCFCLNSKGAVGRKSGSTRDGGRILSGALVCLGTFAQVFDLHIAKDVFYIHICTISSNSTAVYF